MKTVIVEYAVVSPAVLASKVEYWFPGCVCRWKDIDEDFFEFSVFFVQDLAMVEDLLAEFV